MFTLLTKAHLLKLHHEFFQTALLNNKNEINLSSAEIVKRVVNEKKKKKKKKKKKMSKYKLSFFFLYDIPIFF